MSMYEIAKQRYAELGVDTEQAIEKLGKIPISHLAGRATTSTGLR